MRKKYIPWHFHALDYQAALTLLESYSIKGYILKKIIFGIAIFEEVEDTTFKYAIDRSCFHTSYEDMGYQVYTSFTKDLQIFVIDKDSTTSLPFNALEIQQHILSTFTQPHYLSSLFIYLLFFLFFAISSSSTIHVKILASSAIFLYLGTNLILFLLVLSNLLHLIQYKKLEAAQTEQTLYTSSTHAFHQIDKLLNSLTVLIGGFIVLFEIVDLLTSYGDPSPVTFLSFIILFTFISVEKYLKNHIKLLKKINDTLLDIVLFIIIICFISYEPKFPTLFDPEFLETNNVITLADFGIDEQPEFQSFEMYSNLLTKHYYNYTEYTQGAEYYITYFESRIPVLMPYIASKLAEENFKSSTIKDLKIDGIDYGFVPDSNPFPTQYILVKDNKVIYISACTYKSIELDKIIEVVF